MITADVGRFIPEAVLSYHSRPGSEFEPARSVWGDDRHNCEEGSCWRPARVHQVHLRKPAQARRLMVRLVDSGLGRSFDADPTRWPRAQLLAFSRKVLIRLRRGPTTTCLSDHLGSD